MGQIFHACAYDIETKTCCVIDADKFHANCYAHSGAVLSMHYLLRRKPYRVMWGGGYVVLNNNITDFSRTEDLLGISTYEYYESFERNNKDIREKSYYDKVRFIDDNSKLWKKIDVWNESLKYFDWKNTHSVKYSGYLVNHTQKLAIDLEAYYRRSKFLSRDGEAIAIDAVPVLTETGGGTGMALFDGVSTDSTEWLAGKWCGDLLQIVDELPKNYGLINCCFAEIWERAAYCYRTFGANEDGYVLSDSNGKRFEGSIFGVFEGREPSSYIKAEMTEDDIKYIPIPINENEAEMCYEKAFEKAFKEAFEEGVEKGRMEVRRNLIRALFKKGMDTKEILDLTELPEEDIRSVIDSFNEGDV